MLNKIFGIIGVIIIAGIVVSYVYQTSEEPKQSKLDSLLEKQKPDLKK